MLNPMAVSVVIFLAASSLYTLNLPWPNSFIQLITLISLQFASVFLMWRFVEKGRTLHLGWMLICGLIARFFAFNGEPLLEDDYWRYLWDGRVFFSGLNPYIYPPTAPELDFLSTSYRESIGFLQFRTIYPPLAQYIFAFNHWLSPDSFVSFRLILLGFEALAAMGVYKILQARKLTQWFFLFWLNPLLIKEIANSGHIDSAAMAFLVFAYVAMVFEPKELLSWVFLCMAAQIKLFAIVLIPLWWKWSQKPIRGLVVFCLLFIGFYLPFWEAGLHLFGGLQAFSKYWTFNDSTFAVVQYVSKFFSRNAYLPRVISVSFFGLFFLVYYLKCLDLKDNSKHILRILAALFAFSPVVNCWYLSWLVPFAVLERSKLFFGFSFLMYFGYSWFVSPELYYILHPLSFVIFGLLFFIEKKRKQGAFITTSLFTFLYR